MKRRVLFVDDEPRVLQGLERLLRPMRNVWDVEFSGSAADALEVLEKEDGAFDVVVSDMRMPGMDGAQLLEQVKRRYPQIVRIVLSGHSERESILRSIGPTHQFMAKPCDADELQQVVARACALRDLLSNGPLRQLVSQLHTIPSLPQTYVDMVEALKSPDASIQEVGKIIAADVGMTAKVLQLVNSAFFGLRRHVSDPSQAATLLGIDILKALVLSVHIFSQLDNAQVDGFSLDSLWTHSVATGALAKKIAEAEEIKGEDRDFALMAGLIHDAGKLVIAANLPERYRDAINLAREQQVPIWQAEREVFSASHAEVGAYLFGLWGLPDPIVEAVAFHHCPADCAHTGLTPLLVVHAANALEHSASGGGGSAKLDMDYLQAAGREERVPTWRGLLEEVMQQEAD